jgi:hypothetical protein
MAEAFVSSWSMSLFQQMSHADRWQVGGDDDDDDDKRHQGTTDKSHTGQCAQTPKSFV